jgi:hypothetical protein
MQQGLRPPRYLEAYPRFDVVKAKAATERERDLCQFTDGKNVFGVARIGDAADTHLSLQYSVQLPFLAMASDTIVLELVPAGNGVDRHRVLVLCPACRECKIVLVLRQEWQCAKCHGLVNRSQCVPKISRMFERKDQIKKILANGRPKGMHRKTFSSFREEYNDLRRILKGHDFALYDGDQNFILEDKWTAPMPDEEMWFF